MILYQDQDYLVKKEPKGYQLRYLPGRKKHTISFRQKIPGNFLEFSGLYWM
uniref:Uncharacterized protein n=1 Tax=Siphoviridae sp. ctedO8 TaxID=2827907 RepID=A0A8S5T355_9CAUD|nr:MAG TPA: hypothetical protein [Siphoviridae sp. ctedO8]